MQKSGLAREKSRLELLLFRHGEKVHLREARIGRGPELFDERAAAIGKATRRVLQDIYVEDAPDTAKVAPVRVQLRFGDDTSEPPERIAFSREDRLAFNNSTMAVGEKISIDESRVIPCGKSGAMPFS
jgi:hypothetical protein